MSDRDQRILEGLKQLASHTEPPQGFEARFWEKAVSRQKWPGLVRLLNGLSDLLLPIPTPRQAAGLLIVIFSFGTAAGATSMKNQNENAPQSHTVSSGYLRAIEKSVP